MGILMDENMQTAQQYRVSSIPAFVIFKDGKPVSSFVGSMSAARRQNRNPGRPAASNNPHTAPPFCRVQRYIIYLHIGLP